MQLVPSFRLLSCLGEIRRTETDITLPLGAFQALLRAAFREDAFDPAWYRAAYPDVAAAITAGRIVDEITHFIRAGYVENRRPCAFTVDAAWYEKAYQDVALAIRDGQVADAQTHFNTAGYDEARAPDGATARAFAPLLEAAATTTRRGPAKP